MSLLPKRLMRLTAEGRPMVGVAAFERVEARSPAGRRFSEANWDEIICANVEALADAMRAADVIAADSTLRVLKRQVESVDVLLAEMRMADEDEAPGSIGEPRRLVLLEDKLVRNPEARREVLAQLLDYSQKAQSAWTVSMLCERVDAETAKWLRLHEPRLSVMLAQGEMLLVIAGDDIDEDLLRLARRFAAGADPLSQSELCLVAMAIYQRGDENLFVPHVVSAVERHQRQLSIRVTVQTRDGEVLPAVVERDPGAEAAAARRGAAPTNADAQAFLMRAKAKLDSVLLGPDSKYTSTGKPRKSLAYWFDGDAARFKIHFGGFERDDWNPIQVGLRVESASKRHQWLARIEAAQTAGSLPLGTEVSLSGQATVEALKSFAWTEPSQLTEALFDEVVATLLKFETVFGGAATTNADEPG